MLQKLRVFDWRLTSQIASLPASLRLPMLAVTELGGAAVVGLIMAAGLYLTAVNNLWHLTWVYLLTILAIGFNFLLKIYFHRRRPNTPYANSMRTKTYSFPSGHSFGAIATYGLTAMVIVPLLEPAYGLTVWLVALLITALVGFSRVYLGAHYVLDVLGGWVLGGLYLLALGFVGLV